jgi:uncharacterized protein (TIGR00369 family)
MSSKTGDPADGAAGNAFPDDFVVAVPYEETFDPAYGLEIVDDGTETGVLKARIAIAEHHLDDVTGDLHGGVIAALAESLASRGTWLAVRREQKLVMGLSNDSNYLRPLRSGHLHATATVRDHGPMQWLWEVACRDDAGELCAITLVNIAVRDPRPDPGPDPRPAAAGEGPGA